MLIRLIRKCNRASQDDIDNMNCQTYIEAMSWDEAAQMQAADAPVGQSAKALSSEPFKQRKQNEKF